MHNHTRLLRRQETGDKPSAHLSLAGEKALGYTDDERQARY